MKSKINVNKKNKINIMSKKIILVFVTILSINQFINAQDEINDNLNATDIKFGAKVGLNLATITGDLEGIKGRTSFHLGGMAEIRINEDFVVQPELLYSAQGGKYDEFTLALDYLYLPVMGKYFVSDEFSLEAGPQFGYLLSAKLKDNSSSGDSGGGGTVDTVGRPSKNTSAKRATEDVKEDIKSFDFGLNIGASYILENGINLGLRYYLGLANGNNIEGNDGNFKNSVFQLSVGYFFN
jgi:hypothetical protein